MARWEPDARGRLVVAAVELFDELGYGATTTAQIAERAGLSKVTFFRHFTDKREVLFAGQEQLIELARSGVSSSPEGTGPLALAAAGVDTMASAFGPEQRDYGLRLQTIIAANAELVERAAYKRSIIAAALAGALEQRDVARPTAALAAELATRAWYVAYEQWVQPENEASFPDLTLRALDDLRASTVALAADVVPDSSGAR